MKKALAQANAAMQADYTASVKARIDAGMSAASALSSDFLKEAQTRLQDFYEAPQWALLRSLVRCVLPLPASSGNAEQVFSAAGLIDTKLRSKLNAEALGKMTIVKRFLLRTGRTAETFADEVLAYLQR
jgi:hypothetical protein